MKQLTIEFDPIATVYTTRNGYQRSYGQGRKMMYRLDYSTGKPVPITYTRNWPLTQSSINRVMSLVESMGGVILWDTNYLDCNSPPTLTIVIHQITVTVDGEDDD